MYTDPNQQHLFWFQIIILKNSAKKLKNTKTVVRHF